MFNTLQLLLLLTQKPHFYCSRMYYIDMYALLWIELCSSKIHMLNSNPQDPRTRPYLVTGLMQSSLVKMRPLVWALTRSDLCLCQKRTFGCRHTQGGGRMRKEPGISDASTSQGSWKMLATIRSLERGFGRNQPRQHLDLGLLVSGTEAISAV